MDLNLCKTDRGFIRANFLDLFESECSIQESSLATDYAIWLGVTENFDGEESTRMHLNREMVAALLPLLQRFVESGGLREREGEG